MGCACTKKNEKKKRENTYFFDQNIQSVVAIPILNNANDNKLFQNRKITSI
jgi:hypothetical protein